VQFSPGVSVIVGPCPSAQIMLNMRLHFAFVHSEIRSARARSRPLLALIEPRKRGGDNVVDQFPAHTSTLRTFSRRHYFRDELHSYKRSNQTERVPILDIRRFCVDSACLLTIAGLLAFVIGSDCRHTDF
jgi:hypothetical protein